MRRVAILALFLVGCAERPSATPPQEEFMAALARQCGKAFEGRLVTTDPADADFEGAHLVMEFRTCTKDSVAMPFHVGDDRSRVWVVTRTNEGLQLQHDHSHKDGTSDVLTLYGGVAPPPGEATRQYFPADQYSKDLFLKEGRAASVENVWGMEIGDRRFAYELRRPNRHFRVEFDLTKPAPLPPAPWREAAAAAL